MSDKLKRYFEIKELRALEPSGDKPGATIEGYAIIYESETNVGGWFKEIIKRGALDGADLKDVPLLIHHNEKKIPLARSRNNNPNSTLQLKVDEKGLFFKALLDIENNTEAKALYSAVQRQDISGMSFAFSIKEENWYDLDTSLPRREITKFKKIHEISALWSPQYEDTYILARDEALDSADKRALENARSKTVSDDTDELELYKLKIKMKLEGKL